MTMTIHPRTHGIEAAPSSALGAIPFPRLVRVELAKATDTRAARWLLALVALSTAAMMLAPVVAPTSARSQRAARVSVALAHSARTSRENGIGPRADDGAASPRWVRGERDVVMLQPPGTEPPWRR